MELGAYPVFLTVFNAQLRGRPAPYLWASFRKARLALLRLKSVPIKRNSGKIKIFFEFFTVYTVIIVTVKFIKHKYVCTEAKIVRNLIDCYLNIFERITFTVSKAQRAKTFTVFFDIIFYSSVKCVPAALCCSHPDFFIFRKTKHIYILLFLKCCLRIIGVAVSRQVIFL